MRQTLDRLGSPQDSFQIVHVAGTNGKGSTAAFVEAGLRAAGRSTGLFANPHLVCFSDSIRINGRDISSEKLQTAGEEVCTANDWEISRKIVAPSRERFEFMTAIAFSAFRRARMEWVVVEAKVGGRRDATNVVRPAISVITPIDLDHQKTLGDTIEEIAAENAGILRSGVPAIIAPQCPEAFEVIEQRAREVGAALVRVGRDWKAVRIGHRHGYYYFTARRWQRDRPTELCVHVELPLAGEHQVVNALTAIATLDSLGVDEQTISTGLKKAQWGIHLLGPHATCCGRTSNSLPRAAGTAPDRLVRRSEAGGRTAVHASVNAGD